MKILFGGEIMNIKFSIILKNRDGEADKTKVR